MDLVFEEEEISIGLGPLLQSQIVCTAASSRRPFCVGHFAENRSSKGSRGRSASSALVIPFGIPEEKDALLVFSHAGKDMFTERDLHYVKGILRRYELYLEHLAQLSRPEEGRPGQRSSGLLPLSPYYLYNLLCTFIRAACRILPIDALVLTLWSDVVPKHELLQVVGWRGEELEKSKPFEKAEALLKRLGSSFRIDDVTLFYRKFRLRLEVEDTIPRLPVSVTAPLFLSGKPVGTITVKTRSLEARPGIEKALRELVELLLWEMRISRKREELRRRARGDEPSLVSPMAFQDDLTDSFKRAKRFGEAISAIIFSPLDPHRVPEATEESLSRLYLLMRKSVRAIDIACLMEPHGFAVLLPKATHREASKIAERLMKLADEVLKHERYLGRNIFLKYQVVNFPEVAKDEVELWEAIAGAAPF